MDRCMARRRICREWLPLLVCLGLPGSLEAATGMTNVSTSKAGLTLRVSTEWVDGGGYRPVKITVTPPKAAPGDQGGWSSRVDPVSRWQKGRKEEQTCGRNEGCPSEAQAGSGKEGASTHVSTSQKESRRQASTRNAR